MKPKSSEEKGICCLKCSGYFEHRIGSHSDDRGGDSDYPCYCNQNDCKNPDCECHNQKLLDKMKPKELDLKEQWLIHIYKNVDSDANENIKKLIRQIALDEWKFIKSLISQSVEQEIQRLLNLPCMKEEVIGEKETKQAIEIEKINEGNISAKEILEEIGWSFNQRNGLRQEIKQAINKEEGK